MILNDADTAVALDEQSTEVFFQIAEQLGVVVTNEEAAALDKHLEGLQGEALTEQQNIVRLNRQAKLDSLVVRSALIIGQQKKDPLYVKYARAAALKRNLRNMIVKKYGGQATVTARKLLANAGKRNMVDISQRPSSFSNPATK